MRLGFQKNIASSQLTLPIVSVIVILLWMALPVAHTDDACVHQYGLWSLIPDGILNQTTGKLISLLLTTLGVYLIAEFTNANVLLRISSRMLSSTFAAFMGISLCMHIPTPGHVVMISILLSFFTLCATYQNPHPVPTFLTYLVLSLGSLVFPKLLFFVPVYWGCQIYMRSFTLRCFMASLFGVLVPYWVCFGLLLYATDGVQLFVDICKQLITIELPDYLSLPVTDILLFSFATLFFIFGMVNFYANAYLDKTRTRIIYNVIITHAIITILFIALQPQYFHVLLPLLLVDSSLVGGHYIALTYNKFSHIYCIVVLVCMIALLAAQIIL